MEALAVVASKELDAIMAHTREMEEEAEKLRQMQAEVEVLLPDSTHYPSIEEKAEADGKSIYVGNVDYTATAEELEEHFHQCGLVNRVSILCNKSDGHPKGYAFIEFVAKEAINSALELAGSLFKGREIKVMLKRTNQPGQCRTNRPPRGMSNVIRGRGRAGGRFPGGYGHGRDTCNRRFPRRGSSIFSRLNGMMRTATRDPWFYSPY